MKYIVLLGMMIVSFSTFSKFPLSEISDFSGNYNDPSGEASAVIFKYDDLNYSNANFKVERQAGVIFLETPDQSYELNQLPDSIQNLENIDWTNFSLLSSGDKLRLSLDRLTGNSIVDGIKNSIDLKKLSFECLNLEISEQKDMAQELLESCLNNFGKISIESMSSIKDGKQDELSNILFQVNQDALSFKLKAQGFTIKGKGEVFLKDSIIRIHITKAKSGIFNVRKKLFKELKKMENESVVVNMPWIEIYL